MALTRTVSLKMFAETAAAQAKLNAIEAEAKKLSDLNPSIKPQIEKSAAMRQLAVLRAELKAQGDAAGQDLGTSISDGTKKGLKAKGGGSWIAAAVGLGAPLTGPLAAGGLAFAAFGALAAGSLAPVAKAMTGPGGLAAGWATLDARQKTAAAGVQELKTRYDGLSKSMEPRAFQVFNTLLSTANGLLGPSARLATTSGAAVEGFLVKFENDSGLRRFVSYASTVAPQAIGLLGDDVTTLVHSVLTLAQAAGGAGLFELRLLTSGLRILDTVISHLPGPLAGAALGVGGVALALSKIGALSGVLKLTGISAIATEMSGFTTATKGATLAEKGLLATSTALDAITPWGWVALGITALGGLAFALSKIDDGSSGVIATLEKQNHASGFNTQGWKLAAQAIGDYNDKLPITERAQGQNARSVAQLSQVSRDYIATQQKINSGVTEQNRFLGLLGDKYGLTRRQAIGLAIASGVLIDKNGHIKGSFKDAVSSTEAYADSNLKAQKPVSQLAQDVADYSDKALTATARTTALSNALSLFFSPAVTADQALISLAGDAQTAAKALKASGGETAGLTGKQGAARSAFDTYIGQVGDTATAVFNSTHKTSDYNKIIDANIPRLERMAGKNKELRALIQKLIDTENRMHTENVAIHVSGTGSWAVVPGGHRVLQGGNPPGTGPVAARGLYINTGTPGVDDQLIRAQRGELVVPTPLVKAGAVDHLRGMIPGFAAGGVIGSYASHSIPGLNKWVNSENTATIRAIANATAKATAAALRSTLGGGTGKEVARYALGFNAGTAIPYVLGGASPQGWDCSGFTAWVYEHFGLMPGRQGSRFGTSETQAAWVKRTPGPEVGGLAFFNDGVFANPGHVGVITSPTTYISAHSPQTGTTNSPISGAVMFGIPPGRTIAGFESGSPQGGGRPLPGGGSAAANRAVGLQEATSFGWGTGPSWHDLDLLWNKESGWRNTAQNPTSTAYGIPQFLDGTWATVGGRKTSNPGLQILYGLRYIGRKYGDPENAWAHERAFNWYGRGLDATFSRPTVIGVGESGPEHVTVTPAVSGSGGAGGSGGPAGRGGGRGGGGGGASAAERRAGMALLAWFSHLRPGTSTASIRSEETRYLRDIAKYFSGSSAKWRDAEVKRQTGHLIRVGDKIGALNSRIAAARSYQQSVRQGLSGFADLSQMTLGGSMQGSRTLSGAQSLSQQLHGQLGTLKTFAHVLRKLSAAKVGPELIRQVVALGPGDGTAFGQEILAGGPALIKSLNATEKAIGAAETGISRGAASAVYEGRYQPGKNFLSELQHERAGLQKLFREIGAELGREAARWFRARGVREHPGPPGRPLRRPGRHEHPGLGPMYAPAGYGQPYLPAGPVVHIENVHVRETADIAIIGQRVGFAISAAGLG